MKQLKMVVFALLLVLVVVAAYQNIEPIRGKYITLGLDLYVAQWETQPIPIGFLLPLCFVGGLLIMGLYDFGTTFRLRRQVRGLEKELRAYRGQPMDEEAESQDLLPDGEVQEAELEQAPSR